MSDNHLVDANSKIKEEYVKMAHILSFGTGRRRYVDNGGEHSPVWATISWSKPIKKNRQKAMGNRCCVIPRTS